MDGIDSVEAFISFSTGHTFFIYFYLYVQVIIYTSQLVFNTYLKWVFFFLIITQHEFLTFLWTKSESEIYYAGVPGKYMDQHFSYRSVWSSDNLTQEQDLAQEKSGNPGKKSGNLE